MPFNVDEFKAQIETGFANPATWALKIPTGAVGGDEQWPAIARGLVFLCNQAVVPGRHFATQEINTYGPIRKMPYQTIYDEFQVSIFCRTEMKERKFFDAWQNKIQNGGTHQWDYYKNYTQNLELTCYTPIVPDSFDRTMFLEQRNNVQTSLENADPENNLMHSLEDEGYNHYKAMETHRIKFIDAYPLNVQPITLDWGLRDQIINLNVTFTYRKWEQQRVPNFEVQEMEIGDPPGKEGSSWGEMLSWAADTVDTIDLYTGAVPGWMKTGATVVQNAEGMRGTAAGIDAKGKRMFGGLF